MTITKHDKIKSLLQQWPPHGHDIARLKEKALAVIFKSIKDQWILPLGLGVFKKYSETTSWEGVVYGSNKHKFFVGGKRL
jgi:hypothetical protein